MCAMMSLNGKELGTLEKAQYGYFGSSKSFHVDLGGGVFHVMICHRGEPASHTHPEERGEKPSLSDCAEVVAAMFRRLMKPEGAEFLLARNSGGEEVGRAILRQGPEEEELLWRALDASEREDGPMEVDVEAGWATYRAEILETMGPTTLPRWKEAPEQLRECFAAGVYASLRGARVVAEDSFRWSIEGAMEVVNP